MTKKKATDENGVQGPEAAEAGVPAIMADTPRGMETFGRDDIIIPRLRIIQPTSEEGTPGRFRLNLTGDEYETLKVFFVKTTKGRVMFDKDDLKAPPVCGSINRLQPAEFFESPISPECFGCPLSKWDKRTRPECSETYTFLGVDIETQMPFFFQTRGTAMRPSKMFLSAVYLRARKFNAFLCDFEVLLRLKEVKNEKGRYYVPIFEKPTYIKDQPYREEAALYAAEEPGFEQEKPKKNDQDDDVPF